ncbi:hypothetical protein MY3296_000605 [Beauveria thailandica]
MLANDTIEGTASSSRVCNCNGVKWDMLYKRLAGEGVTPELLLYMLARRQNDFRDKEHKCILRVTPKEPLAEKPAVCYLQGEKMWQKVDVNHFEALLS